MSKRKNRVFSFVLGHGTEAKEKGARAFVIGKAPRGNGFVVDLSPTQPFVPRDIANARPPAGGSLAIPALPDEIAADRWPGKLSMELLASIAWVEHGVELAQPADDHPATPVEREHLYRAHVDEFRALQVFGWVALEEVGSADWPGLPAIVRVAATRRGRRYANVSLSHLCPPSYRVSALPPKEEDERLLVRIRSPQLDRYPAFVDLPGGADEWRTARQEPDTYCGFPSDVAPAPHLLVETAECTIKVEASHVDSKPLKPLRFVRAEWNPTSFKLGLDGRFLE
jgi:hypothetical protein